MFCAGLDWWMMPSDGRAGGTEGGGGGSGGGGIKRSTENRPEDDLNTPRNGTGQETSKS